MAITAAEYSSIYTINADQQTALEATHAEGHIAHLAINPEDNPFIAGVLKEIKDLQKEIDYLRTVISDNNDKTTFPGFGTTNSTALAGDTTTISSSQASAITANTAKTSMVIGTGKNEAMAGNTTIPPISITGLPLGHTFDVQVRMMPPAKGSKKGTAVLTWTITDAINRVTYSSNQTLI
jgi:hypothetical protein